MPGRALDPDSTAVHLHQLLRDGQPEPGSLVLAADAAVALLKAFEDPLHVVRRDADAGIAHADQQLGALTLGRHPNAAGLGEFDRVAQQVQQHLLELGAIGEDPSDLG